MTTNADLEALQAEAATAPIPRPGGPHRWPFGLHGRDWREEKPDAAQPPDDRWDEFQRRQSEWEAKLPQGLVSVEYDKSDPTVIERCLAALGRDGAVCLRNAVTDETCDQVLADMAPYLERGSLLDGFFGKRSKRIGALPARSRASDCMVAHPALMKLCDALIGRQVLRMDRDQLAELVTKPMAAKRGPLQQLPWGLDITQIITLEAGAEQQVLHHDGAYCLWDFHRTFEHKVRFHAREWFETVDYSSRFVSCGASILCGPARYRQCGRSTTSPRRWAQPVWSLVARTGRATA